MQKVIIGITMSPDGFIAGEHISEFLPMGIGGQRLCEAAKGLPGKFSRVCKFVH